MQGGLPGVPVSVLRTTAGCFQDPKGRSPARSRLAGSLAAIGEAALACRAGGGVEGRFGSRKNRKDLLGQEQPQQPRRRRRTTAGPDSDSKPRYVQQRLNVAVQLAG